MTRFTYSLYGMTLELIGSIGRLAALPGPLAADVSLDVRGIPDWASASARSQCYGPPAVDGRPAPAVQIFRYDARPYFFFRFPEDIHFLVHEDSSRIFGEWPGEFDFAYVAPVILGPLMGFLLRLRGVSTLHASVVDIDGRALVMMGNPGAGKSTTAAAFAKAGYLVVSDDLASIRFAGGVYSIAPGYPRVCLWPESVRILFGRDDALPLISDQWTKRYLGLTNPGYRFGSQPLPLGAIYSLAPRSDSSNAPWIESVPIQEALTALIANTYGANFGGIKQCAEDLKLYSGVLSNVPVRKAIPSSSPEFLHQFLDVIATDFLAVAK